MRDRLIQNLCELVQIDSESGEEQTFLQYLKEKFERDLGATGRLDGYGNLIATIPAKNCDAKEPLLVAMHGDTVKPGKGIKPIVKDGVIYSSGDTILGADCKAGIAEFIEAVLEAPRHPPFEVVVTREEEVGLVGAKNLDYSLLTAKRGILLDMDAMDAVVIGGPSHMLIDVEIRGKAAHSGMEPEKGISAIKAAAYAITLLKDGRIDFETTGNVGIIQGGLIRNGVPDKVNLKAEVRSLNHEKCMTISQTWKEIFEVGAKAVGAVADVSLNLAYKAAVVSAQSPMVQLTCEALRSIGVEPKVMVITGGLESALYNERGIETVPIGNGVKEEHSTAENVSVEDMEKVIRVLHFLFSHFC
ncbi:MAG: M20/M25/M40 family metallo-hydrolase [Coprothermobacterota bacterium]|nr:M20/M25/M40 family metallo-hydrolase [Coprothermobacterota bacterium]